MLFLSAAFPVGIFPNTSQARELYLPTFAHSEIKPINGRAVSFAIFAYATCDKADPEACFFKAFC